MKLLITLGMELMEKHSEMTELLIHQDCTPI